MSLSQRSRLANQTTATIFEIIDEIAREKKLKQTRISAASQNKYATSEQLHTEKLGVVPKTLIILPTNRNDGSGEKRLQLHHMNCGSRLWYLEGTRVGLDIY